MLYFPVRNGGRNMRLTNFRAKLAMLSRRIVGRTLLPVIFFIASTYFIAQALGIILFYLTPEGLVFSNKAIDPPYLSMAFLLFPFEIPVGMENGRLFFLFWCLYSLCLFAALFQKEGLRSVKRKLKGSAFYLFRNNLLGMTIFSSILLAVEMALIILLDSLNVPTGPAPAVQQYPYEAFFRLSLAPITEELGFRIMPMGVPFALYLSLSKRIHGKSCLYRLKVFTTYIFSPEKAKIMVEIDSIDESGIISGIHVYEWLLLAATSFLFGYAHLYFGYPLWDVGKMVGSTISGLAFGLAYLYYGIQAPILLHWFNNFYFMSFVILPVMAEEYSYVILFGICLILFEAIVGVFAAVGSVKHLADQMRKQ